MINMRTIRAKFPQPYSQLTDEEVRTTTRVSMSSSNGEYASTICKRCGTFSSNPGSSANEAKILDKCSECFDVSETDLMRILSR